jgi:tetratricopeptide (TPR) repeat protein
VSGAAGAAFGLLGTLAAFPRRQAARAVEAAGGRLQRNTSRRTTHAVFGRRLLERRDEATVAPRIAAERRTGRTCLSENGFLRMLGLLAPPQGAALERVSLIEQSGLAPEVLDALALFDAFESDREPFAFRDLILARKYAGLIAGGAGWAAIARSIHRSGPPASLTAKALHVSGGARIYAREGERLCELDGQLLLGLETTDDDPDALFAAAEAADEDGRHAEAAALYGRCLAADPSDAVAAFNRANCLRDAGRPKEAESDYARALQLDPDLMEAWFNLASLASAAGRTDAARRHLETALARDPGYADAVFNLAALVFETGDFAAARRWWARYLELDPDSEWGRRAARGLQYLASGAAAG